MVIPAVMSATQEAGMGRSQFKAHLSKNMIPSLKKQTKSSKKGLGVAQVVEHLSSKHEAPSLIPSTAK
jgi:hypothetical protein